ncbi:nucleoside-diphosphate sugar epimerase/dehydratase [Allobranchiibius sp. CTAmp26]|uniref:polysaccharide biosynthesis protein n=1 Tax=Allobranchiibius sp. CTAmp26 TaxID=2815214 RepID=UPI001AA19EFD|nr:nucleoside-diphosphate sugar epimerase/dehydratase [Allobranchiibius sp. CTAmp26]MBO1755775.1 polysaccharide biosynthesis protein [Allobranchiibius sp. CTAmp26]
MEQHSAEGQAAHPLVVEHEPTPRTTLPLNSRKREWLVQGGWASADAGVVILATYAASWLRYDLDFDRFFTVAILNFAIVAALVHVAAGIAAGPYRIGHQRGSFEETADIGLTVLFDAALLVLMMMATPWFHMVPRSFALLVPALALVGMFTLRFIVRSYRWGRTVSSESTQKVIVFGAGEAGRRLVRDLRRDGHATYAPICLLDDDPRKRHLKIDGVPVRGGRGRLRELAEASGATALVIAIPSADTDLIRDLRALAADADLDVLILPTLSELMGANPRKGDLRRLNLEDLLGRRQVVLDETAIAESINGKTVLVTGAGGSIGSELARQISRFGPRKLILLDRDESALHGVQMSITGRALLDDGTLALVDIRDLDALRSVFARERPQMVFHAAALKHLTLLEQYPLEGWKTNVLGTMNVLQAAREVDVETFVNISTDKAARPTCVLGYSKRIAERLTAHFSERNAGRYVSVRFGNVLGSRGSVITAFTAQIERGGPITVTHPDVERYFMLIPEASQLVLQASAIGRDGHVMVLDMGTPVKIVDVAKTLIELSGERDVRIVYTGLRQGEKLTEELFTPGEDIRQSPHPLVSYVDVPPISTSSVLTAEPQDGAEATARMRYEATEPIHVREQA